MDAMLGCLSSHAHTLFTPASSAHFLLFLGVFFFFCFDTATAVSLHCFGTILAALEGLTTTTVPLSRASRPTSLPWRSVLLLFSIVLPFFHSGCFVSSLAVSSMYSRPSLDGLPAAVPGGEVQRRAPPARRVPRVDVLRADQLAHLGHVAALARLEELAQRVRRRHAQRRQQQRRARRQRGRSGRSCVGDYYSVPSELVMPV